MSCDDLIIGQILGNGLIRAVYGRTTKPGSHSTKNLVIYDSNFYKFTHHDIYEQTAVQPLIDI